MNPEQNKKPDHSAAVEFLEQLRPGGPWVLCAIVPDGKIDTITARDANEVYKFIRENNSERNIYFSVNPTRKAMTSKAAKTDIAAIEYLFADLDPKDNESTDAAKARYLLALETHGTPPTAIIDSGNGIQALWRLTQTIKLAEPVMSANDKGEAKKGFSAETSAVIADAEDRIKFLMESMGSVAGTQNIDRILRLPSTLNLPNKKKIKAGRVACPTKLIRFDGRIYRLEEFPAAARVTSGDSSAKSSGAKAEPKDTATPQDETTTADAFVFLENSLPAGLLTLIRDGVPVGERSTQFHHAVKWLRDEGWSLSDIVTLLRKYPNGIAAKYRKKLEAEAERSYEKPDNPKDSTSNEAPKSDGNKPPVEIFWHGEPTGRALKPWLVNGLIPETGTGLAAGQWGACKTFAMLDLAGSIATGLPFAGRDIIRTGGTLFIAAEGGTEIESRLQGLVDDKLRSEAMAAAAAAGNYVTADLDHLPFAWIEEPPRLKGPQDFGRLIEIARLAGRRMKENFGVDLVLIIVDTLSASADFTDANDAAEAQRIFNGLNALSKATGAFIMAVDHFGKVIETGTRGSSAKEGSADVVLALLADKDISGTISNTRMTVRKLRGGKTGEVTPFDLVVVDVIDKTTGASGTTCVIDWKPTRDSHATSKRQSIPKALKVFHAALMAALSAHGKLERPLGDDGPQIVVVAEPNLRAEFLASYPADSAEAKRKAYVRSLKDAVASGLVNSREIAGTDHLWLPEWQARTWRT